MCMVPPLPRAAPIGASHHLAVDLLERHALADQNRAARGKWSTSWSSGRSAVGPSRRAIGFPGPREGQYNAHEIHRSQIAFGKPVIGPPFIKTISLVEDDR